MKKITLVKAFCPPFGACPAVYEVDEGFVVVGKKVENELFDGLSDKVGPDEEAVLVPANLFDGKFEKKRE